MWAASFIENLQKFSHAIEQTKIPLPYVYKFLDVDSFEIVSSALENVNAIGGLQ